MKSYLTVNEILGRKHFVCSEVIAGKKGLNNMVKWVHIMEVTNVNKLLNGNELILSTGVGWKENKEVFISFLHQLIECRAVGLCIEIGIYTSEIPPEVVNIANEHDFPIIIFHEEVPFVEITQDIHSMLINQHYQMISDLENYSQQLNKLLLTINHPQEILTFFHKYTNLQVALRLNEVTTLIPHASPTKEKEILHLLNQIDTNGEQTSIGLQRVQVLNQDYAELYLLCHERYLTELELLALDRTATALAQHFLRDLYVEERRRIAETEWMTKWLTGELSHEKLMHYLEESIHPTAIDGGVVAVCKWSSDSEQPSFDLTYFKLFIRNLFEQEGFHLFTIEKHNYIVLLLLNKRSYKTWKKRITDGISRLMDTDYQKKRNFPIQLIGIGSYYQDLRDIGKSYEKAIDTIKIQEKIESSTTIHFYDDLHMFRVISLVQQHKDLRDVVMEYLEPVINYDKKYNAKLMETLKTYLACQGSKQETAKKLFIVRQTLYHRIEKLEKLLGSDFMQPEKRMAIEFMLMTYEYLFTVNSTSKLSYKL
ncbi:PucR family transcriptional regulator [Metabacillus iocasae]|uniref:Purine catabolism regulator n=1 Tax=Priestia iocasae TaxID=2291674 RepID=A0ABS2QS81_9BACI|nr:PucR family transcriptional regulator ligand-binding domain-containing protein [Metabacillus iocasae]MBM7701626.1 purine catabolism regulator [Metabacillus iocasae]